MLVITISFCDVDVKVNAEWECMGMSYPHISIPDSKGFWVNLYAINGVFNRGCEIFF